MSEGMLSEGHAVEELMDRWMNDPSFKDQMKSDPMGALQSCGIKPTDAMVAAMQNVSSDSSVEELRERIIKWGSSVGGGI